MKKLKIIRTVAMPAQKKLTWGAPFTANCFIKKTIFAATSFDKA